MSNRSPRFAGVLPDHGHLSLTRKDRQTLTIGEGRNQIVVEMVEAHEGVAKLGIYAPRDVVILRDNAVKTGPRTSVA